MFTARSLWSSSPASPRGLPDFVALTKPHVMALAVFIALVGLGIAPAALDPLL